MLGLDPLQTLESRIVSTTIATDGDFPLPFNVLWRLLIDYFAEEGLNYGRIHRIDRRCWGEVSSREAAMPA